MGDFGEEIELHHCECFEMHGGKAFPESSKKIRVVAEGQRRIESANNMKLRQRFAVFLLRETQDVVKQHRVAAIFTRLPSVGSLAKLTVDDADVRIVNVPIDVVVRPIPIQPFTCVVGETSQ